MLAVRLTCKGLSVTLRARTEEEAEELRLRRENRRFLAGMIFRPKLKITASLAKAVEPCHLLFVVVPAQSKRRNIRLVRPHLQPGTVIVSAAKGLEIKTALRMSQLLEEELGSGFPLYALSGPNLVREIAAGLPASSVVASPDIEVAAWVQKTIMGSRFRVYAHDDLIGVGLGGALKNIIAIGAGAADEFGYGDNAKAAFMTWGLAEIARLGVAAGANPLTFAGLAGIGDLVCTCSSRHSRNHYVGEELAKGRSLEDIEASMIMVAEGIYTTKAARKLARKYGVEMPITEEIYRVLFKGKDPRLAVKEFFGRAPKRELEGPLEEWLKGVRL